MTPTPPSPTEPPARPEAERWRRRIWTTFRGWPLWVQILVGLVAFGAIVGPFTGDEESATDTASNDEVTTTERQTTTTADRTTTTEEATTTTAPATTTEPPATTTAAPPTTIFPDDGDMTITPEGIDPWPFTVDEGVVACEGDAVTFEADGTIYAINGFARQRAEAGEPWVDIYESNVWAPNPAIPGTKVDIGGVIDLGLRLCEASS